MELMERIAGIEPADQAAYAACQAQLNHRQTSGESGKAGNAFVPGSGGIRNRADRRGEKVYSGVLRG